MAHHKSAQKRIRQTEARATVNRSRETRVYTVIKAVELAIKAGNKEEAQNAFKLAKPVIMSSVSKGVLKLSTASRKVSRLSARVKSVSVAS